MKLGFPLIFIKAIYQLFKRAKTLFMVFDEKKKQIFGKFQFSFKMNERLRPPCPPLSHEELNMSYPKPLNFGPGHYDDIVI